MKTQILLFSLLCMFACSLQAQVQQRKATFPSGLEQVGSWINPPQPGFKPERMVVPAKRNMFDSSGYVWKWDTIFCYKTNSGSVPYYRVTRKYSSAGDSIVQLTELHQSSYVWANYARESFTFDSAGNWMTYLSEKWENNAWVNQSAKKFVYNSNGEMVDWKETWWQNNRWVNDWHNYRHFDANGLNDTSMSQTGQDSLWVNYSLYKQSYDTNGYRISAIGSSWINNGWEVTNLDTFTNNSNGDLLTYLRQVWENSSWVNSSLSTMTYDTAGNRLSGLSQQWQNNTWENDVMSSYLYDGNGNNILCLSQGWSGGSWDNWSRDLYLYDTSNNMLSHTSQHWDNSLWKNGDTQQYTYDEWGNSLTGKYLWWYQNTWQPYDGSLQVFADHHRDDYINLIEVYRYEAVLDSIMVFTEPGLSQGQVTLYPNPAHSMVYVSWRSASTDQNGSLTMYDLRGQVVLTKQMEIETTGIDIIGLKPGVYFVRFRNNRETRVLKFIKN
jgi:hypothetical protein